MIYAVLLSNQVVGYVTGKTRDEARRRAAKWGGRVVTLDEAAGAVKKGEQYDPGETRR